MHIRIPIKLTDLLLKRAKRKGNIRLNKVVEKNESGKNLRKEKKEKGEVNLLR
jgi:hypothetical protein